MMDLIARQLEVQLADRVNRAIRVLSYREREIIKLRYGIGDGYTYTLEECGHIFKVTRERIRGIERKALGKFAALGLDLKAIPPTMLWPKKVRGKKNA